jgi:hypothetical protein
VVAHTYNTSTQEAEGGLLIGGQPELHSETLSQKKKKYDSEQLQDEGFIMFGYE